MVLYGEISKAIERLLNDGEKMLNQLVVYAKDENKGRKEFSSFLGCYQMWYTESLSVIKQLIPDRKADFESQYKAGNRKEITVSNYTISDALNGYIIRSANGANGAITGTGGATANLFLQQIGILKSAEISLDSILMNITIALQANLLDNEIDSARVLLKNGFVRAAGAVCGVVLETHFKQVAERHNVTIKKANPTISEYNDAFKDASIYDVVKWRFIQHLGDIRNYCVHSKDREPTKEEVAELINGTDNILKTIN